MPQRYVIRTSPVLSRLAKTEMQCVVFFVTTATPCTKDVPDCKNNDLFGSAKPGYYFGNSVWKLTYDFEQKCYLVTLSVGKVM